ncbi:TatD family hydrolase [Tichowtungia aerotolerans]|uniref:YchF/TatD family DNA exonuclease n=1 Tax=Tichowtungia aerotolerans TaxID=2697043 RepID=A0A6P1MAY1_9BACT|nr:TatD family hydrolase [Tichowtungia aerotolerans]QHI69258.1 YchF/TatD family DNA exonuclease [Tichowtungia aerotolerans]
MFFDTHVHFDDFAEDGSLEAVLERAEVSKVWKMLAVGGSPEANELSLKLVGEYPGRIFGSAGYDRHLAGSSCDFQKLREQAARPEVVAIGETGLDYFYEAEKAAEQKDLFFQCLETANTVRKPVIVHTRDADDDTLGMLTDFSRVWRGESDRIGVIHCFTRDEKLAKALLDLGFCISFSGIVTFRNADPLREVAKMIPPDRMLIETDSPYLAPVPHRGKRCEPAFVADTAALLAELRGVSIEDLAMQAVQNAVNLFGVN